MGSPEAEAQGVDGLTSAQLTCRDRRGGRFERVQEEVADAAAAAAASPAAASPAAARSARAHNETLSKPRDLKSWKVAPSPMNVSVKASRHPSLMARLATTLAPSWGTVKMCFFSAVEPSCLDDGGRRFVRASEGVVRADRCSGAVRTASASFEQTDVPRSGVERHVHQVLDARRDRDAVQRGQRPLLAVREERGVRHAEIKVREARVVAGALLLHALVAEVPVPLVPLVLAVPDPAAVLHERRRDGVELAAVLDDVVRGTCHGALARHCAANAASLRRCLRSGPSS